jgi:ankyrin repeat protein
MKAGPTQRFENVVYRKEKEEMEKDEMKKVEEEVRDDDRVLTSRIAQNVPIVEFYHCQYEMTIYARFNQQIPTDSAKDSLRYFQTACASKYGNDTTAPRQTTCSERSSFENMFSPKGSMHESQFLQVVSAADIFMDNDKDGGVGGTVVNIDLLPKPNKPPRPGVRYHLSFHHAWTRYHLQLALWGAAAHGAEAEQLRVIARSLEAHGGCADGKVEHTASYLTHTSELSTPLIVAVQRGHLETVKELLAWHDLDTYPKTSMCSSLTHRNRDGHSALYSAAFFGKQTGYFLKPEPNVRRDMVSAVLTAIIREDKKNRIGVARMREMICLGMSAAASKGDWNALKVFLDSNILSAGDPEGHRNSVALALLEAAASGQEHVVENILAADARQANDKDCLLHVLAPPVCTAIGHYSADVPLQNHPAEMTALIAAVRGGSGNLRIVQMILQHLPESVHLRDVYDMTALSWAVKNVPHHDDDDDNDDDDDIVRAVDPASADATKARRMIALLLDAGADPSARVQFQNELLDFVRDNVNTNLWACDPQFSQLSTAFIRT